MYKPCNLAPVVWIAYNTTEGQEFFEKGGGMVSTGVKEAMVARRGFLSPR
jgi:hypothetical protein